MKRARKPAGRLTQEERDRLTTAAKGVQPGERCAFPVQDELKRGSMCLKPATVERDVPTGFGDEKVALTFCAKHNAAIDAHGGDVKAAAEAASKRGDVNGEAPPDAAEQARRADRKRRAANPAQESADDDARLARALHRARGTREEL